MTFKQIIKKYPKAYIHYDDNGSWTIYKSHKEFIEHYDNDTLVECELVEGYDYDNEGYIPTLVAMMAKELGLEVGSE